MPLLRCDICGCAVSQVKSVFVCERCSEGELKPGDPGYDWTDIVLARFEIKALRARVEQLEAAQRWIPMTVSTPEDGQLVAIFKPDAPENDDEFETLWWNVRYNDLDISRHMWMPLPQPPEEVE